MIARAFSRIPHSRYRLRDRDFTRTGPLTPELLTVLLLYMVADGNRRGYRHVLRAFWDDATAHGLPLPSADHVSAPSFCEARHKLSSELLRDLLYEIAWATPDGHELGHRRWKGRRVFAVDSTRINLQRDPELEHAFGVPATAYSPQLLLSVLVDVCGRIPMDLEVSGFATSERDHLEKMMTALEPGDVVVLDRGYGSHDLLQALAVAKVDYLVRVPGSSSFLVVDELRRTGARDKVLTLEVPTDGSKDWKPLRVRVLQIDGPDGDPSFFITSLPTARFSRTDIARLYHMRWEAEEFFKLLEGSYVGQGQYRSKSASGVAQEIHALVLFLAIAQLCSSLAAEQIPEQDQIPSQKGAVLAFATFLTRILLEPDARRARTSLRHVLERIASTRDKRRPHRSYPRRSFKPTPKWVPSGRRGA